MYYNQNLFHNEYVYNPEDNDPPSIHNPYVDPRPPLLWTPEQMEANNHHLLRLYKWSSYFFEMALILGRQINVQLVARHVCDPQTVDPSDWVTESKDSKGQDDNPAPNYKLPDSLDL